LTGVTEGSAADLRIDIGPPDLDPAVLGAAVLCAAGGERPPRRRAVTGLVQRMRSGDAFAATLAGALIVFDGAQARIARETGDRGGRRGGDLALPAGTAVVWDGRFEVRARVAGAHIGHLAGRAARLDKTARRELTGVAAAVRPALPLVTFADGRAAAPTLRGEPAIDIRPLALERLGSASGAIVNEEALRRMAETGRPS
jgi:tRNA(Ile)-lysidine synthase